MIVSVFSKINWNLKQLRNNVFFFVCHITKRMKFNESKMYNSKWKISFLILQEFNLIQFEKTIAISYTAFLTWKPLIQMCSVLMFFVIKGKLRWKLEHSLELFCNITLYMHYNAVQNTLFVECSVTRRKNELNNWKSSVKLKHSYYIESKRSNMPETEIETIRIYVLVFLNAIRSNIREKFQYSEKRNRGSKSSINDAFRAIHRTPAVLPFCQELNFVLRAVILLYSHMFLILKCQTLPVWLSNSV